MFLNRGMLVQTSCPGILTKEDSRRVKSILITVIVIIIAFGCFEIFCLKVGTTDFRNKSWPLICRVCSLDIDVHYLDITAFLAIFSSAQAYLVQEIKFKWLLRI